MLEYYVSEIKRKVVVDTCIDMHVMSIVGLYQIGGHYYITIRPNFG